MAIGREVEVLRSFSTPGEHPGDITWDGQLLWHNDTFSAKIFAIDPLTGMVVRQLDNHGFCVGLCFDGQHLIQTEIGRHHLLFTNPSNGEISHRQKLPAEIVKPGGVCSGPGYLWVNDDASGMMHAITIPSGQVLCTLEVDSYISALDASGKVLCYTEPALQRLSFCSALTAQPLGRYRLPGRPSGIVWCERSLWYVDRKMQQISEIQLPHWQRQSVAPQSAAGC